MRKLNKIKDFRKFVRDICRDQLEGVNEDYADKDSCEYKGACAGLDEAQKCSTIKEFKALLQSAEADHKRAWNEDAEDEAYWEHRAAHIKWVCNVISAAGHYHRKWTWYIVVPNQHSAHKAFELLGWTEDGL